VDARLALLDTGMEPLLDDLGIHRLICRAGDNRITLVVLLELVARHSLTCVELCQWTAGRDNAPTGVLADRRGIVG
jgi:hypothetical protein